MTTQQMTIPTEIKAGTEIVEIETGKTLVVTHDYRATDRPIGLHFQVLAMYTSEHRTWKRGHNYRQFLFSDIGTKWNYK